MVAIEDKTSARVKRFASNASAATQNLITAVEGIVCGAPRERSRGIIVYLSPWWRRASGEIPVAPVRIRFSQAAYPPGLITAGCPARIYCQDLAQPGRGAHAWTATGLTVDVGRKNAAMQVPVIVHDRMLNRVVLDRKTNTFVGKRERGRQRYLIRIERSAVAGDPAVDHEIVLQAAGAVRRFERHGHDVRMLVSAQVCDLYNKRWRNGRRQRSSAEVAAALQLSEMTVRHDGSLSLQLLADDLFYGHWIEVGLDPQLGLVVLRTAP